MFKKRSIRRRYLFAGLVAVAAVGLVAVGTRAAPKLMSSMCEKMMQKMMPEMKKHGCEAEGMCKQMMASTEQTAESRTCEA